MELESGMSSNSSYAHRDHQALEPRCKVFLSHSGAQKGFVEQLCLDLERRDRVPFFDKCRNSLPIGEHFPNLIFQAIQQCQVGVVVLSEDFFTRTKWPMLELVAMVKSKMQNPNFKIIPVFLSMSHVQCRDEVNHNRWLSVWHSWIQSDSRIDIQEWKRALEVFGSTNGIFCDELGEVKCRADIVEAICKLVPPETKWDDSHVQGRLRFCKEIREKIDEADLSQIYGVRVVGLYGVGGIGKTTICKVLCNEYFAELHGRVHHLELESNSEVELIRAMLKRLTETKHDLLGALSFDECLNLMKRDLYKKRVFLTIDNVYNEKTIEKAKAYLKVRYEPGSIVIVTARSLGLLQNLKIDEKNCIEMPELEEDEAKCLFLYHATLENESEVDKEFILRCVEQCYYYKGNGRSHYHPLALKVLGTQVGYESEPCNLQFDELDIFNQLREREHPIFSILRKSFDTLLLEDQLLFMDAALFYPERSFFLREWEPINIFEWLNMMHGSSVDIVKKRLMVLKKKSLLEDLGDGSTDIGMHDLWREFCVMETKVGKRWIYEDINSPSDRTRVESRLSGSGWENLQKICLMANNWPFGMVTGLEVTFDYCSNVTVLKLQGVVVEDKMLDVSLLKHLKSMECIDMRTMEDYEVDVLGLGELKHLVVLIWDGIPTDSQSVEEIGWLKNLQVLQLHSSLENNNLPNLVKLSLLQHVVIDQFNNANNLSGLNSRMSNLQYMDIRCCKSLRTCPGIDDLVALQELNLSRCSRLREVPSLQMLKNLRKLNIFYCRLLEALPGLGGLVALQELRVIRCMKLAEFPNMSNLRNLQVFNIEECPVKTIPGLGNLIALQSLAICECAKLEKLPDVCKLTRLELFDISYCPKLQELWEGVGRPRALEALGEDFHGVGTLPQLETLKLDWIVFELPDLSIFPRLKKLHLQSCGRVTSLICSQPLPALEVLSLQHCWSLKALPDLSRFERLRKFKMSNCGVDLQDVHEIEILMARCNVSKV